MVVKNQNIRIQSTEFFESSLSKPDTIYGKSEKGLTDFANRFSFEINRAAMIGRHCAGWNEDKLIRELNGERV